MTPYLSLFLMLLATGAALAYPLDGGEATGIRRLSATTHDQARMAGLPPGARLSTSEVRPSGIDATALPATDAELSRALRDLIAGQEAAYAIALVDLSRPDRIRYAAHQPDHLANVGSVGKILVLLAWLQKLADLYPQDLTARENILKHTRIRADEYSQPDQHAVPITAPDGLSLTSRPLQAGDEGNLYEYLDWMLSASSNGAAAMAMKELAVLQHFGKTYPPADTQRQQFLDPLSAAQRGRLLLDALLPPIARLGLDPGRIRQGSLFTSQGKQRMAGTSSYATPRELLRLLTLIEANRFVDPWSSLQAKRLLYMTQKRIRYASHPALNQAAVYFKSGSLYSCQPEPEFKCRKYMGNKENRLASLALVEFPAGQPRLRYGVAIMSNVLRVNSAVAHQTLALHIHRLVEGLHLPEGTALPSTGAQGPLDAPAGPGSGG